MKKHSTRRRRWQADPAAGLRLLSQHIGLTPSEQSQVQLPVRMAYESLKRGAATQSDIDTLASAVNISMICAESIDEAVEDACVMARDALVRTIERRRSTGQWGLDGPGISQVANCIDVYEQLTALLTPIQLKNAMTEALKRIRRGHYETEVA